MTSEDIKHQLIIIMLTWSLYGEFLLHIPCCLYFYARCFSYTSDAVLLFMHGVSLTHPLLASFSYLGTFTYTSHAGFIFIWGVSLTHPVLASFLFGEFLLHIPCWIYFSVGSFSYTSHAGFFFFFFFFFSFFRGVSLKHNVLVSFYVGSFSYTSHADFLFMWGVFLIRPVPPLYLCGEFLLHIPWCPDFYAGVSLTHPVLASFVLSG